MPSPRERPSAGSRPTCRSRPLAPLTRTPSPARSAAADARCSSPTTAATSESSRRRSPRGKRQLLYLCHCLLELWFDVRPVAVHDPPLAVDAAVELARVPPRNRALPAIG